MQSQWIASFLLEAGLLGLMLTVIVYTFQAWSNPLNKVPGPLYARFTNLPLKWAFVSGRRIFHVDALHKTYGPLVRVSPSEVSVADAQAFKKIHGIGHGFLKTPWYAELLPMPRPGLFTMIDSQTHAARRRLLSRPFSKTHLRQHWEGVVRERVELAVSHIHSRALAGPVDAMKWWTFMGSDVSAHLMYGQSFETLEHGEVSDYIRKLQMAVMGGGIGAELPLVRWVGRRLPITICQDLWAVNDYLMNYGKIAVENMRANGGNANIFAGMMHEAEKGERLDDLDVQVEATNFFVAGTDSTAITLTFLTWAVMSRPDLQRRVEDEVKTLPESFSEADVENLGLLNAVIEETLRLYGAAPGALPRAVPTGGVSMGGLFLPQETVVSTQAYTYHRNAKLFPKPLEFIPERWMASRDSDKHPLIDAEKGGYSPFGAGGRKCIGIHLAYMQLRLASAVFFRRCAGIRLAPSVTSKSMELENYFIIAPAGHKCEVTLA